ncbi:HECT-domain-containing protein [Gigaspora margarita]|uniref:HECT-type E3 ubiquitin transferase n=1 Tax=Gigaspora margarita TaxID=4874 RepID=A0A8H4A6X4_GIGMA|nr:HECT-domain-containing protein [Gigaspora margarita]
MFSFDKKNAEKQAFVDKARSEREKRELQRVKQKEEQKHAQAVNVIQNAYKKHYQRKKDIKHLRELWDNDVLFSDDSGSNSTFSVFSTEILDYSYLMFAFFNPSNDEKDLSRFSYLCKMILSTTTPSIPAKSQAQETSPTIVPFHSLLLNERYRELMLKILKKILWQCVICVVGFLHETKTSNSSKTLYLSGPELRLLIYFLDPKNYIVKGTIASYSSIWNQQLILLHDYLIHQGFYKQIGYGIMLRVNFILSLQSRAAKAELLNDDKKLLKSSQLWLMACLRCSLFPLGLSNKVDMTLNNLQSLEKSQSNVQDRSVNIINNFISYILTTPCLLLCFDQTCLEMFKTYNIPSRTIYTMCTPDRAVKILQMITGNDTIFLAGNIVELMSRIDIISLPSNNIINITFHNFIESIISLLQHCQKFVSTKQSNTHYQYHPIFTWYSGTTDPNIPTSHFNRLISQLEYLWQKPFLLRSFNHVLNFKFDSQFDDNNNLDSSNTSSSSQNKKFTDKKSSLNSSQITLLAVDTQDVCRLYLMLSKLLNMQKHDIMMNLTFIPRLVPALWQFMTCLGPKGRMKIFLSETVIKEPEKEPLIGILELFCESCGILLLTIDDDELYEMQTTFSIERDLKPMATFFNKFCFALLSNSPPGGNPPAIFESARRVLLQLHSRDTRRVFTDSDHTWLLIKDPKKSLPLSLANFFKKSSIVNSNNLGTSFLERIRNNDPISVKILNLLPHTIPFETRLDIFREFLQNNSDWSDIVIKIRRDHVLDDGYKQLGRLTATQIKGQIRVMFVNETGVDEIGVDQGGPFKEFITQLIAEAFDPKCGLFAVTPDGSLYPNPHSAHTKLPLYTFLGRMIARAMKEKILLDSQFAEFFLSKISGRAVFLEDLIGWNNELWKNLIFLKRYEGNVEDLGLYFVVDEEVNGRIISKELRAGGSHMAVTNYNRIQYIYLMADYKLNKQIKEQTEAFISGFQSMMPINRLRMFSPPELRRVMSGEDVDWDVSDLRQHTTYQSGYFDQHRTIRNLWSILEEFDSKNKNAFLKFVTSCSRPPLGGFKYLQPQFTIRMVSMEYDDSESRPVLAPVKAFFSFGNSKSAAKGRLPTSSTCFNLLKLPAYPQKSILKEKLKYAIHSNTGFELH